MYDEELEKIILYAIIFEKYDLEIKENDFFNDRNKRIAIAIITLKKEKQPISILSIQSKIKANKNQVIEYISTIGTLYNKGMNISQLYNQFIKLSQKRAVFNILQKSIAEILNEDIDLFSENLIKQIKNAESVQKQEKTFIEKITEAVTDLEQKYNNQDDYSLYTGFNKLDNMTCGLHNQELTIIGARPGVGKTTLALQIAEYISQKTKEVLFISLEMSDQQLIQKMISNIGKVKGYRMKSGTLEDSDWAKICEASNKLSKLKFNINANVRTIQQIEILAKKLKYSNKLDLLIIDYIQLLKSEEKYNIREQEVADISRRLKLLSLEINIPIIALCQLNRNASEKEPTPADLRESGSLEQDADNIIFLYKEKENENDEKITLKLAKQRTGETGKIQLLFKKQTSEFKEV